MSRPAADPGGRIADASERTRALDVTRSFIVQAPAGSGKTSLLVERFLRLLGTVRQPEEVVAITFTRKAAAEMRGRVLENVPAELAPRIRIQTIDSLCASLTARMPVLARFGAQPRVTEDAAHLCEEAAARALREPSPAVTRLLEHLDNFVPQAVELLAQMLARRDQWLRAAGRAPARAELEGALRAERERLIAAARRLHPDASPDLAREVLTKAERRWKKRPPAPAELVAIPGLEAALAALLDAPSATYADTQWEALEAILALLAPAAAELRVLFAERGEVDFTEVAHGALVALGTPDDPTDLMLSLDVTVKHLLVDEFQDTSNAQWELLERLTAGWQEGDGRTLFLVGDPMQSIYRFRDAQVGLFLRARREGLPGVALEPLTLATNFRSQGAIVDWVNRMFPRLLPAAEDEAAGAVPYAPSVAAHAADPEGEPGLALFASREEEAQRVVELVRAAEGRSAILVRNRSHLGEIVPALKSAGLRFRAVEIEQLGEKQVVQDLYALTRALTHLADRVAWLAILRSPWCGLSLEELASLFEGRRDETVWEVIEQAPRLANLVSVLGPALENRLRGTLRDCVEGAWLALGGPACVEDATDLEDAEIFLDELERLEDGGEVDFALLRESLARLYALPDVEAGPEAVEIMTVHKAKGLEFDTVIVPGLDRPTRAAPRRLLEWRALPGGSLLLAPIDETGGGEEPLYKYVRQLEREAEDIEAGRLLYVACTRAKRRLFLLGCVKFDDAGAVKPPPPRSLLKLAWEVLPARMPEHRVVEEAARGSLPAGELRRLSSAFTPPAAPAAMDWTVQEPGRAEEIEFSWAQETVRVAGVVVHAWLQRIAEDGVEGWDAARVGRLKARFEADLRRRGVAAGELAEAVDVVLRALKNAVTDERGRWLLGRHPVALNEYRLRNRERSFRIDRYFEDASGEKWVVDYKTSVHAGGGAEAFLDEQMERYAGQVEAYAEAVRAGKKGLYFPLQRGVEGVVVSIDNLSAHRRAVKPLLLIGIAVLPPVLRADILGAKKRLSAPGGWEAASGLIR